MLKGDASTVQDPKHLISGDWMAKRITALTRARNLFLIGCYTGLRVSDFSRLRDAHIGKFITIKTQKTGTPVVIPIHPVVRRQGLPFDEQISAVDDVIRMAESQRERLEDMNGKAVSDRFINALKSARESVSLLQKITKHE